MFEFQSTSHIEKNAEELRAELKKIIVHAFVGYGGAIAIDGWTDKFKKNQFFGVTIHYISTDGGELVMNERTLLIRELDDNETKDGEYVKQKIETYLQEFGLLHCIDDITFVTDRGTNMVSALVTAITFIVSHT